MTTNRDHDLETIARIRSGLDELERAEPVFTPDPQWFEHLVKEQNRVIKKKLLRDLGLFLAVAVVVLSVTLISFVKLPAVYLALQAAVVVAGSIFVLATDRRKRVRRE